MTTHSPLLSPSPTEERAEPPLYTTNPPSPTHASCPPHMLENLDKPINRDDYKAYLPIMPPNFRGMMHSGSLVMGVGAMLASVECARVVATLPHHFMWLDAEHMSYDPSTLTNMIRTANHVSGGRMAVVVRVPQCAPDLVTYCLNAGAAGIVFPHVQNAEQAKALVDACRFPPHGKRGYPPFTLFSYEKETGIPGKNTYDVWDDHIACIAQIEDPEGVKNVEEICAVPGIDGLMVGTHDLRLELGIRPPGYFDGEEPEFQEALEKVTEAASKHGPNGMAILSFSRPGPDLEKRMHRGWRAFKITTDVLAIHQAGLEHFDVVGKIAGQITRDAAQRRHVEINIDPVRQPDLKIEVEMSQPQVAQVVCA